MYYDVTDIDLCLLVKKAYDFSKPQGLGFLHYDPTGLTDAEARALIGEETHNRYSIVNLDYVKGRACKFIVFTRPEHPGRRFIKASWYDHTEDQLIGMLKSLGHSLEKVE
jgi:hypothetical protein